MSSGSYSLHCLRPLYFTIAEAARVTIAKVWRHRRRAFQESRAERSNHERRPNEQGGISPSPVLRAPHQLVGLGVVEKLCHAIQPLGSLFDGVGNRALLIAQLLTSHQQRLSKTADNLYGLRLSILRRRAHATLRVGLRAVDE